MNPERALRGAWVFWPCAALALAIHGVLLASPAALRGGADLVPHLRLVELMREAPALRSVYAPAYHALGALLEPWLGLAAYPKLFAALAALLWLAGFRFFQRAAALPDACAALFALSPYGFALSWCLPKLEAAGYGLALIGLGLLLRRQRAGAAALLVATFLVHTASALLFGLAGGVLALARRDARALVALAAGTLAAAPLFAAHRLAGCTLAQALLFSEGDYLRAAARASPLAQLDLVLVLANPVALGLAGLGAGLLWRRSRPLACLCGVLALLYLNELWLAPFGARTTLDLLRGLSVLAIPVATAAGLALEARPRALPWVLAICGLWAAGAAAWAVPRSCYVREIRLEELRELRVDRCRFRWQGPALQRRGSGVRLEDRAPPASGA